MDLVSATPILDDDEDQLASQRSKVNPRFRRLAFHLAGAEELDIPSELALISRAQDLTRPISASRAMEKLVACHMSFLKGIALKVARKNNMIDAEEDLLSEAVASLLRTIRRYCGEAHQSRLSTYATFVVSGDVMMYALRNREAYAVGSSSNDRQMIFGYDQFVATFEETEGVAFDATQSGHVSRMAQITNLSEGAVRRVAQQQAAGPTLDVTTIDIEDKSPYANPALEFETASAHAALLSVIDEVRGKLSHRNRTILTTLLEHDEGDARSLLARRYGITAERVGQIYRDAVADIRDRLARQGITAASA